MNKSYKNFIFNQLTQVEGYIDPLDSLTFLTILESQTKSGLGGGSAEIGVYFGRSFLLVKKLMTPNENALAIDLFDIGQVSDGKSEQYKRFLRYAEAVGLPMDENHIITGDSTDMVAEVITSKTGPVRFFSVDGGHQLEHIEADSLLALNSLAPHGVIAFDDTFNPEWPEVSVGVIDFIRANRDTHSPFCVTNKKTYVCRHEWVDTYQEMIRKSTYLTKFGISPLEFLEARSIRLHHPISRRIAYELISRVRLGRLGGISAKVYGQ